jgi:hypothetical protein
MLNVVLGVGVLSVAAALLFTFRARQGITHPTMLTTAGQCFPLFSTGLIVLGLALIVHGLSSHWL